MSDPKRVADVIADILVEHGIQHVFMVTGGGAMHLNDALGCHPQLKYVACHHEQVCAMAAESYCRMGGKLAAVNVTTGPGGTNALTGVFGAWTDSIGMVVISGQVKWETTIASTPLPLRQLGDQEIDIVRMVSGITKYAVMVTKPEEIRYHMEKAIYLAKHGRPGPVWLDVPINVQATPVDATKLKGFDPKLEPLEPYQKNVAPYAEEIASRIAKAKRPVVMVGGGVRISGSHELFLQFLEKYKIPAVTAWNAHDVLWNDHPAYVGRPGSIGDRSGNFAVQNADVLLILGNRVNIRQASYNWKSFARHAFKIMVDIDYAELMKPTLSIDLPVHADLKDVLQALLKTDYQPQALHRDWTKWCKERVEKYPTVLPQYWEKDSPVNPYCFMSRLFDCLEENDLVVTGDGTACVTSFQAATLKKGQRLYTNSGCASMGYDLPAAIGAHFATNAKRIICLAGDGSIQMNLQDLQTFNTYKIPAKIFVLNNQGYHSIRQTQQNFFKGRVVGCGTESGLGFPSFERLADAYEIPYRRCERHEMLTATIQETIHSPGVQMCEIILDLAQTFAPRLSSKRLPDGSMVTSPLEEMSPFLPPEEHKENILYEE